MPSFLIIDSANNALKIAEKISKIQIKTHPDVYIVETEGSLKIDHVREIKHFLTRKPYQSDHQLIWVSDAHRLTIPAQNALLKTLEEPPEHVYIFLSTTFKDRLLPTIISRCLLIEDSQKRGSLVDKSVEEFDQIAKELADANTGVKISLAQKYAYPKPKAIDFCQQAIEFYRQQIHEDPLPKYAKNLSLSQITLTRIEKNIDPRLAIEHFLLQILV